ncbi:MAG: DUF29 family protein [Candidatus Kapaibacteriota bacterium]|jgi:hypothetical protein
MDEILQLREYLVEARYDEALLLIDEMEEMAKDDKITRIGSYAVVLLVHLIKQEVEQRTTRSWDVSIAEALDRIHDSNARRKAHGVYLKAPELQAIMEAKFGHALRRAASEIHDGKFTAKELVRLVDKVPLIGKALHLILTYQPDESASEED